MMKTKQRIQWPHPKGTLMASFINRTPNTHRKVHRLMIFCILIISSLFSTAYANQYQSSEMLRITAKEFISENMPPAFASDMEISIGKLDRRLRLRQCEIKPVAFLPPGSRLQGKLTIGLRCNGSKPWTVYIPANIKIYTEVITAAHPLSRNSLILKEDIIKIRREISRLNSGYFSKENNVIGKILTRNMNAGQVFTSKRIKKPLLVHRGDEVTIIASYGGIKIRAKGKALKDAAKGELIPVRNIRSKRIVQGIATKAGIVNVRM